MWPLDLVISLVPLRGHCGGSVVIDRFDLWRGGAHAVWLDGGRIRIRTVAAARGRRPWVAGRRQGQGGQ
ncbi:MAG: hypothetical protein VW405_12565 [Rhodospirillaceae bacterium]